ncbi:MAG: hypothetical protein R2828_24500 [Saprospiraceae bacterium]
MRLNKSIISILLILLVIVEGLCNTIFINYYDKENSSIVYLVLGLFISILPLIKVKATETIDISGKAYRVALTLGMLGISFYLYKEAKPLFANIPIDYRLADMLPILKIMCERFMQGEEVYAIIPQIWDGMQPIYLPALWMPLIPATYFDFDVRWTSVLLFVAGLVLIVNTRKGEKQKEEEGRRTLEGAKVEEVTSDFSLHNPLSSKVPFTSLLILVPIYILVHDMIKFEGRFFAMTEESMVVFYYLLLAYAIAKEKTVLTGIALSLCMLSRYSLAIWAIMYVLYVFFFVKRSKAIAIGGIAGGLSIFLMVVSQGMGSLHVFLGLQENYINAIINEKEKFEPMINISLGVAKFFVYENLATLHQLFMVSAFLVPALSLLLFARFKNKINTDFFALCSLKLTLVVFYNLLVMPFMYLFFTSTLLSIAILNAYFSFNPTRSF